MNISKLKTGAILSFIVSMLILLVGGYFAKDRVPPYPQRVVSENGEILFDNKLILKGQDVYQKYGLMDHGSIWGHGTLRGLDFSATSAHILGEKMREYCAQKELGSTYNNLTKSAKEQIDVKVISEIKENRFDKTSKTLTLTNAQAFALEYIIKYWDEKFLLGDKDYGFLPATVAEQEDRINLSRFFFWTGWVASTNRIGEQFTYTNNWPPDESIGNRPTAEVFIWSWAGILSLFLVLGIIIYLVHRYELFYGEPKGVMLAEKLASMPLTNSQYKAAKFFLVVISLFMLQTLLGGLLARYTVTPAEFYIPVIGKFVPYSWAKSWHLQLAIFWIATTWVATAVFLAPVMGGKEPKKQGVLVEILFIAILTVAVGSLTGEVLSIKGYFNNNTWFWLGHQGWEYLELGRLWQILLFVGLVAWLGIVYRGVFKKITFGHKDEYSALVTFYVISAILVVAFFGFGFFYGRGSHLTIADYWRWFVVHIWVEGIFEFFGVAIISMFLVILGLVDKKSALRVAYFTAIIVFFSGIVGTAHHYFWFGGPSFWLALGSVFSSLEPIPIILLVVRAWMEYKSIQEKGQEFPYKWPLMFLVASSFWNFVGAGVFGFIINLPIINYYEHGTYLTVNHGHAALFGVYGMLSISLLTFTWRSLVDSKHWSNKLLKISFWGLNGGLAGMVLLTLLPIGILQLISSFTQGLWFARSAAFYNKSSIQFLANIRIVPDTIIILVGIVPLAFFLFTTFIHIKKPTIKDGENLWEKANISIE